MVDADLYISLLNAGVPSEEATKLAAADSVDLKSALVATLRKLTQRDDLLNRTVAVVQDLTKVLQGQYKHRDDIETMTDEAAMEELRCWPAAIKRISNELAHMAAELEAIKAEAMNEQTPPE
jgi:hypothetical protein